MCEFGCQLVMASTNAVDFIQFIYITWIVLNRFENDIKSYLRWVAQNGLIIAPYRSHSQPWNNVMTIAHISSRWSLPGKLFGCETAECCLASGPGRLSKARQVAYMASQRGTSNKFSTKTGPLGPTASTTDLASTYRIHITQGKCTAVIANRRSRCLKTTESWPPTCTLIWM